MARNVKRPRSRWLSYIMPDPLANWTIRRFSRPIIRELSGVATDRFLELLLRSMDLAFVLCKSFRRNIEGFDARYVFATGGGEVGKTADFSDADMRVDDYDHAKDELKEEFNVRVTFSDPSALRRFLFAKDQDILNSLLANEVEVDGNLNYLYKFGFMAKDLGRRLGLG